MSGGRRSKAEGALQLPFYSSDFSKPSRSHGILERFRVAVADVEAGRRQVPVVIEYTDVLADVNRDATRVEEVRWIDRPVQLRFTLWTPRAWTFTRRDVAKSYLRKLARPAASRPDAAYRSGEYFLCFDGDASDLLWFGDVVAEGGLWGHPGRNRGRPYVTSTPGVLTPPRDVAVWVRQRANRGALVLEPESLYRGILFGTALTMLGLTSGARLAELLQISMDHFLPPRPYRIKRNGQDTGELDVIHLQALLPKGRSHERERQPYNVSGAIDLLTLVCRSRSGDVRLVLKTEPNRCPLLPLAEIAP